MEEFLSGKNILVTGGAGKFLKYAPVCDVREGLKRTVDWYFR